MLTWQVWTQLGPVGGGLDGVSGSHSSNPHHRLRHQPGNRYTQEVVRGWIPNQHIEQVFFIYLFVVVVVVVFLI